MFRGKSEDELSDYLNSINSNYTIEVERDGEVLSFDLDVQTFKMENVITSIYEEDDFKIGYIRLSGFTFDSYDDFKEKFEELNKNNITSLILDLRDNPGGEEKNMINIASLFLSKDKIIFKKQTRNNEKVIYSKGDNTITYPIVILGNSNTASCSEILMLALMEGCDAKFIGTQTYGKGVGQSVYYTKDYSYKFTSQFWTSPSGISINNVGITPDIYVENSNNNDFQLQKAKEYIKSLK